jgi:hypothetical protein
MCWNPKRQNVEGIAAAMPSRQLKLNSLIGRGIPASHAAA